MYQSQDRHSTLLEDAHFMSSPRRIYLDTFFEHENHAWPPSLALNKIMRQNTKSELVPCLETLVQPNHDVPDVDVRIVDGAALVRSIDPKKCRTTTIKSFPNYSLPYIVQMLSDVIRVDIV